MELVTWTPGADFGVGYEILGGNQRGDAVYRPSPQGLDSADGQTVVFVLEMIDNLESLQTTLNVSVKAGGSYFGIASGSAKANFVEQCSFQEYSLFLMASVSVRNAFRQMRDVTLKPQAFELLRAGKVERFREQYGDQFVNGIVTGGEYFAVFRIDTKDASDFESTVARIKGGANLGLVSFDAAGSFSKTITEISSSHCVSVHTFKQGGDPSVTTDVSRAIEQAVNFPATVSGQLSVPYQVSLLDYRVLDMPDLPNWVDLQNAREVMEDILAKKNMLTVRRNAIDYVLTHSSEFEPFNIPKLNEARNLINKQINDMMQSASRCVNNMMTCKFAEVAIPQAAVQLPKRKGSKTEPKKFVVSPATVQAVRNAIARQRKTNILVGIHRQALSIKPPRFVLGTMSATLK